MTTKHIHVATIFPEFFEAPLSLGLERIAAERDLVAFHVHQLRDYSPDRHRKVDDRPFGGGPGMVMRPEPFFELCFAIAGSDDVGAVREELDIVLLSPRGALFTQHKAQELAASSKPLVVLCGRYEGVDERVAKHLATDVLSIGDYVLSGGEPAALVIIDSIVRLIPGVAGQYESVVEESHSRGLLEYPQYTRPETYRGFSVPDVLLSGNHRLIRHWRTVRALRDTAERRPDLLEKAELTKEEQRLLSSLLTNIDNGKTSWEND